jgi:hypothetical protein
VNIDGAAYVVVTSIRDDPTAKGKIEDSSRRRRKCTITLRRNGALHESELKATGEVLALSNI